MVSLEELLRQAAADHDQARFRKALVLLGRAARLAPRDAKILLRRARCLFIQGRLEEARRDLLAARRLSPGDHDAARELAQLMLVSGLAGEAEAVVAELPAAERPFWLGYRRCRERRYAEAARLFARCEGPRASLFSWAARVLAGSPARSPSKGRELLLVGVGSRQPFEASAGALRALASCDAIYSNLSDSLVADLLGLFPVPCRSVVFRRTAREADESSRAIMAGFKAARRVAMVTRGQPLVYGRLAWRLKELCGAAGIRLVAASSTSAYDAAPCPFDDRAPGLQVLDAWGLGDADPRLPAVVFMPDQGRRAAFLAQAARLYPPERFCGLVPSEGAPVATTVAGLGARLGALDHAGLIYFAGASAA